MKRKVFAFALTLIMTFVFSINCFALQSPTQGPIPTDTSGKITLKPVSSGNGSSDTWKKGSNDGLSFKSNKVIGKNVKVYVDGKELSPSDYTIDGNTITLTPAFLESLSGGKHTITIDNAKESATSTFKVAKEGETVQPTAEIPTESGAGISPKTSDNSTFMILGSLMLMTVLSFSIMLYSKRKISE